MKIKGIAAVFAAIITMFGYTVVEKDYVSTTKQKLVEYEKEIEELNEIVVEYNKIMDSYSINEEVKYFFIKSREDAINNKKNLLLLRYDDIDECLDVGLYEAITLDSLSGKVTMYSDEPYAHKKIGNKDIQFYVNSDILEGAIEIVFNTDGSVDSINVDGLAYDSLHFTVKYKINCCDITLSDD